MIDLKLSEWQQRVDILVKQMGGYWPPLGMLAALVEEVGEVARNINGLERIKAKKPTESHKELGEELADTIYALICIANHYKINLNTELERVLNKYAIRDKNRFNGSNEA
jgi:NTP pyrophosphatase (non-canonical NTP hydrolase)